MKLLLCDDDDSSTSMAGRALRKKRSWVVYNIFYLPRRRVRANTLSNKSVCTFLTDWSSKNSAYESFWLVKSKVEILWKHCEIYFFKGQIDA